MQSIMEAYLNTPPWKGHLQRLQALLSRCDGKQSADMTCSGRLQILAVGASLVLAGHCIPSLQFAKVRVCAQVERCITTRWSG